MLYGPDVTVVDTNGWDGDNIQAAIDSALGSGRACVVYVPAGDWTLKDSLRLYSQASPGIQPAVRLVGAKPAYPQQGGGHTRLVCNFPFKDRPAIDIQATRASTVENLVLQGQNNFLFSLEGAADDAMWLGSGVTEDHVAIAIDRSPGHGSSGVLIDNVSAKFFAGGISIGASGHGGTLNSENHTVRRFCGHFLGKAGLILGQHQSKGVKIQDSYFFGQQYWIDCARYGLKKGYPPVVSGCNVGGTQRLFNLVHSIGTFACHGLFVESTLSLGTVGWGASSMNVPAVFTGCHFNLWMPAGKNPDTHLFCFQPTLFQGCTFQISWDTSLTTQAAFRIFNGQEAVFDTCVFLPDAKNGRLPVDFDQPGLAELRRCRYRDSGQGSLTVHGQAVMETVDLGSAMVAVSGPGRATFTLPNGAPDLEPGDLVGRTGVGTAWLPKAHVANPLVYRTVLSFGIVNQVSQGVVTLHQVPETVEKELAASPGTPWALQRRRTAAA